MHPLRTTVDDLIEGLKKFEHDLITKDAVLEFMQATRVSCEALRPFTFYSDNFYTRNLIYRDRLFEVMIICWKPGQKTAVHTHNGQLGWMAIAQGEVAVHNYKYLSCNTPGNQNVVGIDCLGGASHIELERCGTELCGDDGRISTVDKLQTIHQIENTAPAASGCISLHVYSLPIESCIAFDLEKQHCYRRTLRYFSRYGKVELELEAPLAERLYQVG